MTKQTIEVEGLPEGWKAVAYRRPIKGEQYLHQAIIWKAFINEGYPYLIVEKIQPRRIVLEEVIDQADIKVYDHQINGIWFRKVKETDIPLTNEEPKLSLSVDECRNVRSLIKDFENLGWFVNPARSLLLQKITEFIKDK